MPDQKVIAFRECLARPDSEQGTRHLLSAHLLEVARGCGSPEGDIDSKLGFLAGLAHDAGKARSQWQAHILGRGPRVNHAPLGSALFTYMAATLLEQWEVPRDQLPTKRLLVLRLAQDIHDHHGALEGLTGEVPWKDSLSVNDFDECDLDGFFAFVAGYFSDARFKRDTLRKWFDSFPETWEKWQTRGEARVRRRLGEAKNRFAEAAAQCVRMSTAKLIAADRYHASRVCVEYLDSESAARAEDRLIHVCRARARDDTRALRRESVRLREQRQRVQDECVQAFLRNPDGLAYTLLLPTGLGKTLSAMRVALRACAMAKCRRIVYVAPYLSILSQASREIATATGLDVLEHHHLSVIGSGSVRSGHTGCAPTWSTSEGFASAWPLPPRESSVRSSPTGSLSMALTSSEPTPTRPTPAMPNPGRSVPMEWVFPWCQPGQPNGCCREPGPAPETTSESDEAVLLDSWTAPVVVTTFNQLFRALFPTRAQHTMRLRALERAFIIVDEPQIIDGDVWNLFLAMLEAVVRECRAKVLFSTATLPPLELGMSDPGIALAPEVCPPSRYHVRMLESPLDETTLAELAVATARRTGPTAVILNTIRDAAEVYRRIQDVRHNTEIACYNLTGCMTAPHKAHRIAEISNRLEAGVPLVAVCTQILECGVDLSFRSILRALPVLPSVVQAAGRANRHAEGMKAEVTVFRFLRQGEIDTRKLVYRPLPAREATDACFAEHAEWEEPKTRHIVDEYYRRVMARSTATSSLESLVEAACGSWSSLGKVDPFGPDYPHVDVFVPYGESLLREHTKRIMAQFAPRGCEQLYEKYLDRRFMASLSFQERKRFMAVLQHFLVSLDLKTASRVADLPPEVSIAHIIDPELYREETGLAHLVGIEDDSSWFI